MLNCEDVYRGYVIDGLSDSQIASLYGVTRNAVVLCRETHGIKARKYTGEIGEGLTQNKLLEHGLVSINMNKRSKIHPYDLLVTGIARIEVKSAKEFKKKLFSFVLTQSEEKGIKVSSHYLKLKNGRVRKIFTNSCDFLILCGITEHENYFYVIPSTDIPDNLQTITTRPNSKSKWNKYLNRYDLIKKFIKEKTTRKWPVKNCSS